jgi:ABC-type multidrug transport system fused ATPase/permease subunit
MFSFLTDSLVFNSNIDKIELGIGFHFSNVVATSVSTISTIIVAFFIQWQLTLIIVCTLPLAYAATRLFSKVFLQFAGELSDFDFSSVHGE